MTERDINDELAQARARVAELEAEAEREKADRERRKKIREEEAVTQIMARVLGEISVEDLRLAAVPLGGGYDTEAAWSLPTEHDPLIQVAPGTLNADHMGVSYTDGSLPWNRGDVAVLSILLPREKVADILDELGQE